MNVEKLTCFHFRNYETMSFSFTPKCIHFLYGKNAQGKTNLIEAIYFLSHLRSFRTNQMDSMIMHGCNEFCVQAIVESNNRKEELKVIVDHQKKHLFRFQNSVKKYSDFIGIENAILFCPDDLLLFTSSPKNRRRFIDMELMKLSRTYTSTLSSYQKLLKQRNQALKPNKVDECLVHIYLDQMIDVQSVIIKQRNEFIHSLMKKARELYPFFSNEKEEIEAKYMTFISLDGDMKVHMKEAYEKAFEKEKKYHQTLIGIHRDDILFELNGKPVCEVASQGQKRSFVLALKLGLAQIIYEKSGQYPILLLDDVFSELDDLRKRQLIEKLPRDMQIFITTTERLNMHWNREVRFYDIEQGRIKEVYK